MFMSIDRYSALFMIRHTTEVRVLKFPNRYDDSNNDNGNDELPRV